MSTEAADEAKKIRRRRRHFDKDYWWHVLRTFLSAAMRVRDLALMSKLTRREEKTALELYERSGGIRDIGHVREWLKQMLGFQLPDTELARYCYTEPVGWRRGTLMTWKHGKRLLERLKKYDERQSELTDTERAFNALGGTKSKGVSADMLRKVAANFDLELDPIDTSLDLPSFSAMLDDPIIVTDQAGVTPSIGRIIISPTWGTHDAAAVSDDSPPASRQLSRMSLSPSPVRERTSSSLSVHFNDQLRSNALLASAQEITRKTVPFEMDKDLEPPVIRRINTPTGVIHYNGWAVQGQTPRAPVPVQTRRRPKIGKLTPEGMESITSPTSSSRLRHKETLDLRAQKTAILTPTPSPAPSPTHASPTSSSSRHRRSIRAASALAVANPDPVNARYFGQAPHGYHVLTQNALKRARTVPSEP